MNYKESITALLEGLKGIFENKTATEASAIAQAATKPSTIFYTSDTHAIVVGGHVYGRSNQVSADAPFAYLPADVSSPSADPQFDGNHDTIYIQPIKTGADAGKIKLWWYVNGAWTSTDTLDLVLPTDAEDITYDLTNTPDLGSGDVQSAIEALDGKVFGEILNKKVVAKKLRNGSPGNLNNTYAVTTYMLPTNGKQSYRFYTTRPNKENCIYHWGFIMSSDASMIGTSQTYRSVLSLVYNSDANKTRTDWSMLVLTDIAALAVGIAEYNTSTQSYSTLRIEDFEGYELGFIPIDLPDRGSGLAEQPRFIDEAYEKRGWWVLSGGINTTGALNDTSGNYSQYYYNVSAGDKVMIRNSSNWAGTSSLCYAVYDKTFTKGVRPTDAVDHFISDYSDWRTSPFHSRGSVGQDYDLIIPQDGKTLVVMARITADDTWAAYQVPHVYIQRIGQKAELKDNNHLISTWTDDEIITSTTLAVGSIVPYWSDGTRYGCRGVRLNVKEGDKILLDTYSPALFGLIFTDENRVVKALYDDRRFDGVWTAPVNGYCYIQDVLYRECYHYASAHGHLAYMAHDARKRVAKGGDWYNEYAPRLFNEFFPYTDTFTASGITRNTDFPIVNNSAALLCYSNKKFQLHMAKLRYADGSPMVSDGSYIHLQLNGSDTGSIINDRAYPVEMPDGKSTWIYAIVNTTLNAFASTMLRPYIIGLTRGTTYSIIWEKIFVHTSSDFGELYALAQKIINGEVEVDNFYGVKEKEVDFVRNAIGLQSISDLGYNILDYGATLPIDEDGYKYAKEIYDRYKDNPPSTSTQRLFENDQKLVYLPSIDFSVARGGGSFMQFTFQNCYNLICVDDIEMPSNNPTYYNNNLSGTFLNCRCLKRVGNITCPTNRTTNLGSTFAGCYALEYVGKIIAPSSQSMAEAFRYTYSLKRIEELNMKNVNDMSNCFQYCGAEYLLMKNIGMVVSYNPSFSALLQWGINSDENPDARQSLVDSLLTYSYDRVNDPDNLGTAGTTCTISLSANSYAQLTASEIEAITAKGYTLTHP